MPELLRIHTDEFEFSVWCNDISKQQKMYQGMLLKRAQTQVLIEDSVRFENICDQKLMIYFSPALVITEVNGAEKPRTQSELIPTIKLILKEPFFFENTQYQFEWLFLQNVKEARLTHRSQLINEGFRFVKKRGLTPARLTGTINTGNDVGWIRLPLKYVIDSEEVHNHIAFEVLPTKMDMHKDLPAMYQVIDKEFPLWRFSLVEKTEQNAAKGVQRDYFPLMWLASFGRLRDRFEQGLKVISQAPHSRLQPHVTYSKASRLQGRIPYKLGVSVKENLANGQFNKKYRIEKKKLSVDTPENRFIKMIVTSCREQLAGFEQRLRSNNKTPDRQRLSDDFLNELHMWQQPLKKVLKQSFLKDVNKSSNLSRESLVLQQKTGYSLVYSVWQELKFYLDVFSNQSSISMKSVAEIYEVWCFLTLKNILQNELGFEEIISTKSNLKLNDFFEYQLKDGFAGAFEFKRSDGVRIRLAHEPRFTKKGIAIRSYLVSQEPDIVLEVTMPEANGKRFIWLFDAKYRIKTYKSQFDDENIDSVDYAPDDAINQMHRYRDALIHITREESSLKSSFSDLQKSRPVFGAFVLYPGFFNQKETENPYADAINEISIGAFSLLPDWCGEQRRDKGYFWLLRFLREQIGSNLHNSSDVFQEKLYMQEAARIPYYGMEQVFYPDLTMTVALAGQKGRSSDYFNAFENGTSKWYHLPQKTFIIKYQQHIVNELRYLALASTSEKKIGSKKIDKLWPIKNVVLVPRNVITTQQSGRSSDSIELYYLFELGRPLTMQTAINHVPHRPVKNSMKLTTMSRLESINSFRDIEQVYEKALA